jgi:hypothetical protein
MNVNYTAATLTAQTASGNTGDLPNKEGKGVIVGVNVSAASGAAVSYTVTVQGKDEASGEYYDLLSSAAIAATGFTKLVVYPGVTVAANAALSHPLPKIFRVKWVIAGALTAITGTIGVSILQ